MTRSRGIGRGREPVVQTKVETKLAAWRVRRGMTQAEVVGATGIPPHSYWRLERGLIKNPRVRHLANCAYVLGCQLEDLIEDEWRQWSIVAHWVDRPEKPPDLWRS